VFSVISEQGLGIIYDPSSQADLELASLPERFVSGSLILSTLKMEAIRSSETWVLTRFTRRHNPEDGILQSSR
jgi:hypothetical protein